MKKYTDYLRDQKEREAEERYRARYSNEYALVLTRLLKNKDFRFFLSDLFGFTKPFESSFDEKGNVSSFNAGKQQIGLKIFKDILAIDPEFFTIMMKEETARSDFKNNFLKEAINGDTK